MRRILVLAMLAVFPVVAVQAQPALTEPPEFPMGIPGPSAQPAGGGCFLLARGTIAPGDVDWLRVTIPWPSSQTIVDVDFPTNGTIGSALTASVVGGSSGFNIADNNVARDAVCGLSATSTCGPSAHGDAASLDAARSFARRSRCSAWRRLLPARPASDSRKCRPASRTLARRAASAQSSAQ